MVFNDLTILVRTQLSACSQADRIFWYFSKLSLTIKDTDATIIILLYGSSYSLNSLCPDAQNLRNAIDLVVNIYSLNSDMISYD